MLYEFLTYLIHAAGSTHPTLLALLKCLPFRYIVSGNYIVVRYMHINYVKTGVSFCTFLAKLAITCTTNRTIPQSAVPYPKLNTKRHANY